MLFRHHSKRRNYIWNRSKRLIKMFGQRVKLNRDSLLNLLLFLCFSNSVDGSSFWNRKKRKHCKCWVFFVCIHQQKFSNNASFPEFSMQFKKSLRFFVCLFLLLPHCHASFALLPWSVRKELQLLSRLHLQASVTRFVIYKRPKLSPSIDLVSVKIDNSNL